ncbi:MAG: hypothetical protein ACYC8T_24455 [Myxococcaceae bacterium]
MWERYTRAQSKYQEKLFAQKSEADQRAESILTASGVVDRVASGAGFAGSVLGGYFFDSLIGFALLLGQAVFWVLSALARILGAVLYVLGPLALVFAIPRGSGVGGRWLRTFVTVLTWPILSALLTFTLEVGLGTMAEQGFGAQFGAVASGLLLAVIAVATPMLASALVGGGAGFVGAGLQTVGLYAGQSGVGGFVAGALGGAASPRPEGGAQEVQPGRSSRQGPPPSSN